MGGAHGLGSVRRLVQRPFTVRERVTEWEPGERMSYDLLDGMNARGYHATASLEDAPGGGTVVRWSSQWESADPITAFLLRTAAKDTVKRLARAAAACFAFESPTVPRSGWTRPESIDSEDPASSAICWRRHRGSRAP